MKLLEKLDTFLVLAECRSFTETAKRLYCSQPTITNHIQQLEEMFDSTLCRRSGKVVQLTPQGELLKSYAEQMRKLLEEAAAKIKYLGERDQKLSIYVSNYISGYYFTDILNHFHKQFPSQFIEVFSYCYEDLRKLLQEGRTNMAIMPIYPEDEYIQANFDITVLFEDEFKLVLPPHHPWISRKILYTRDLHNETILLPQSPFIQRFIEGELERCRTRVRYTQMSNFEMTKQAVKSELGIAFLPYRVVENDISMGTLAVKSVASLRMKRKNGFIARKNIRLTDSELAFRQDVEQYFQICMK